jgi:hypothetical protein
MHRCLSCNQAAAWTSGRFDVGIGGGSVRGNRMAIQDYARSIAATRTVSKEQVFRYLEIQFARADRNHDGALNLDELANFEHAVSWPEADQR